MSIRLRLTLWYSGVLAVTIVAVCVAVYLLVSFVLYAGEKNDMRALAGRVYEEIDVRTGWNFIFGQRIVLELPELNEFGYSGYFLQVVDEEGRIWRRNTNEPLPIPQAVLEGEGLREPAFVESRVEPYPYRLLVYNVPIMIRNGSAGTEGGQFAGLLQVATTIDDIEETLAKLRTALTLAGLMAVAAASTLGWFLARKALKPIEAVIEAADRIGMGADLNRRIPYDGPQDEIGRLTATVNGMLFRLQSAYAELEEAVAAQRRFVSDASHELRTPLTTIRGNVDVLDKMWRRIRDEDGKPAGTEYELQRESEREERAEMMLESIRDIAGEAERMSRLVGDMLVLARADAGQKIRKAPVALKPLVEEVARKASHLPRRAKWLIGELSPLDGARVYGDADALQQLLFIFIENAFKYTPSGEVELSALSSANGRVVGLRIRDTGIGMDKEDVPLIFDRFYRADKSRGETSGIGLGLAIGRWIIDEHEGSVEVLTRRGEGTSFIVWLPVMGEEQQSE